MLLVGPSFAKSGNYLDQQTVRHHIHIAEACVRGNCQPCRAKPRVDQVVKAAQSLPSCRLSNFGRTELVTAHTQTQTQTKNTSTSTSTSATTSTSTGTSTNKHTQRQTPETNTHAHARTHARTHARMHARTGDGCCCHFEGRMSSSSFKMPMAELMSVLCAQKNGEID